MSAIFGRGLWQKLGASLRLYLTGEIVLEADGVCLREAALPGRQGRLLLARLAFDRAATS